MENISKIPTEKSEMAALILQTAEKLTKERGFDGFSYRDIGAIIGIKSASIHYHFPTKGDLAVALVVSYIEYFSKLFAQIDSESLSPFQRVETLLQRLSVQSSDSNDICLCGMLAANKHSVPEKVHQKLGDFFLFVESWIEKTLRQGITDGSINLKIAPEEFSRLIIATIEGALLLGRIRKGYTQLFSTILQIGMEN